MSGSLLARGGHFDRVGGFSNAFGGMANKLDQSEMPVSTVIRKGSLNQQCTEHFAIVYQIDASSLLIRFSSGQTLFWLLYHFKWPTMM
jgi:hypothetical protein